MYIFDLDNTLIMTDELNNEAYNYALSYFSLPLVTLDIRITRKIIEIEFPYITEDLKKEIIKLKQKYFIENLERTVPNKKLIGFLKTRDRKHFLLWTSADICRAKCLLNYYGLENQFVETMYSNKKEVSIDVYKICEILACESNQLIFYEDDFMVTAQLNLLGHVVIDPLYL